MCVRAPRQPQVAGTRGHPSQPPSVGRKRHFSPLENEAGPTWGSGRWRWRQCHLLATVPLGNTPPPGATPSSLSRWHTVALRARCPPLRAFLPGAPGLGGEPGPGTVCLSGALWGRAPTPPSSQDCAVLQAAPLRVGGVPRGREPCPQSTAPLYKKLCK